MVALMIDLCVAREKPRVVWYFQVEKIQLFVSKCVRQRMANTALFHHHHF